MDSRSIGIAVIMISFVFCLFLLSYKYMSFWGSYYISMNVIALVAMWWDKRRSEKKHFSWRVPESLLYAISFFGGVFGCGIGMFAFRHKTLHDAFRITLLATAGVHAVIILFFCLYW